MLGTQDDRWTTFGIWHLASLPMSTEIGRLQAYALASEVYESHIVTLRATVKCN